jgi:hypothetical protein
MIRDFEVERFREIIKRSGVAELLDNELKGAPGSRTGRPSRVSTADWLAMQMATANYGRPLHSSEVRALFTDQHHASRQLMIKLATRIITSLNPNEDQVASECQFETRLRKLGQRLAWLASSAPQISKEEAQRREAVLQDFSRALLKASQPNDLPATGAMAVDGTAVESYGQFRLDGADPDARPGHRTPKLGELKTFFGHMFFVFRRIPADGAKNPLAEPGLIEHLVVRPGNVEGGVGFPVLPFSLRAAQEHRLNELLLDAAWFNTKAEEFAQPLQQAGVRVLIPPKASQDQLRDYQGNPMYFATPLCSGAPQEILDIARDLKRPATLSLEPNFSEEMLSALADNPSLIPTEFEILDLSDDELEAEVAVDEIEEDDETTSLSQPTNQSVSKNAEGGEITKRARWEEFNLRPVAERRQALAARKKNAYENTQVFLGEIKKLEPWALTLKEEPARGNNWSARYECPAVTGNVICPRYAPSLDYSSEGRPTVSPPATGFCSKTRPADKRDGAVQRKEIPLGTPLPILSMTLPRTVLPKMRSKHMVGTYAWIKSIQRRGSIEGSFGTLKSRSGIGLTKGYFAVGGQVQHTILGTIALAVLNYQTTYAWIARGGITHDLVFAPAPQMYGIREVTAGEDHEHRTVHLEGQRKAA